MRTKPNTKTRRNKRWQNRYVSPLSLPQSTIEDLEEIDEATFNERLVNSGIPRQESTYSREFNISASNVPVAPGSWLTDYDGLQHTINRLTAACMQAKTRLEWSGETIRGLEIALWQKEVQVAKLQGLELPKELPPVPFFEVETNPSTPVIMTKALVNRMGMIYVGGIVGAFGLVAVILLLFFW